MRERGKCERENVKIFIISTHIFSCVVALLVACWIKKVGDELRKFEREKFLSCIGDLANDFSRKIFNKFLSVKKRRKKFVVCYG